MLTFRSCRKPYRIGEIDPENGPVQVFILMGVEQLGQASRKRDPPNDSQGAQREVVRSFRRQPEQEGPDQLLVHNGYKYNKNAITLSGDFLICAVRVKEHYFLNLSPIRGSGLNVRMLRAFSEQVWLLRFEYLRTFALSAVFIHPAAA